MNILTPLGRSVQGKIEAANADLNLAAFLRAARRYLGMDVAFIGEFANGRRVFRYVDSDDPDCPVERGASDPLEATYCQRVVDGRLPAVIPDVRGQPAAAALPVTGQLGIGAYVGVPVRLESGEIFGTFCCYSRGAKNSLGDSAEAAMTMFANMMKGELEVVLRARLQVREKAARVQEVLNGGQLRVVYQPVVGLRQNELIGFEALSRFPEMFGLQPDVWFADAGEAGLGVALELRAVERALAGLRRMPDEVDVRINASPALVMSGSLAPAMEGYPLERIVLEVTEHEPIADYERFLDLLAPLRTGGMRLAVDDAGAGHATLRHILKLRPEIIKLDISLIRGIDADKYKSAMAAALIRFALDTGAEIVAEGIETLGELNALRGLGAHAGQGNYLGAPLPLERALMTVRGLSGRGAV